MPRVCGGISMSVDRRFFPKEGVIHQGDLRVRVRVTRFFPKEGGFNRRARIQKIQNHSAITI
jgi:hypothetical protein